MRRQAHRSLTWPHGVAGGWEYALESGCPGSRPNPAISWLCDTEEVTSFSCALETEIQ